MDKNPVFQSFDQKKLELMVQIKQAYDEGRLPLEEAQKRMREEVGQVSPSEYAAAEQLYMEEDQEECKNENIAEMLVLFKDLLVIEPLAVPFGHPLDAYQRENKAMLALLDKGAEYMEKGVPHAEWQSLVEEMWEFRIHYKRKQNQLYARLEEHGFTRPTVTMWAYDDYVRDLMRVALNAAREHGFKEESQAAYLEAEEYVRDLIEKEEMILLPTSLRLISEEEFGAMEWGDREIGFFGIDMPAEPSCPKPLHAAADTASGKAFHVAEGLLTLEQINLIYKHLPVDLSYVDEDDIVRFYSDTKHRVFPRSSAAIGREVRNCHPAKSVHIVNEIIDKFRDGSENEIEFWIDGEHFIYIKYVAVRDEKGRFRGVLEMMQDCTHIRSLEGSRTLLTWDGEQPKEQAESAPKDEKPGGGCCCGGKPTASEADGCCDDGLLPLSAETKLKDIVKAYPQIVQDLPQVSQHFKKLQSPMGKMMMSVATLGMMSENSGVELEVIAGGITKLIEGYRA